MASFKPLRWFVYKREEERFPYWVFIEEERNKFIFLRAQDKWPGPGKNIFCKFEGEVKKKSLPREGLIDKCEIFSLRRYGKRLNIILNRSRNKRCWFIFLKKEYKSRPGQFYYQVFWITQSSSLSERRGAYIPYTSKQEDFIVIIDKNERYPYRFGKIRVERRNLSAGDYALEKDGKIICLVERKTKDNFLHELSYLDVLRLKLEELSKFPYKAFIFESDYASLVSPKNKFWKPSFIAEVLGDLFAEFPQVQFLFFKGRKSANNWLLHYFRRIYQRYLQEK